MKKSVVVFLLAVTGTFIIQKSYQHLLRARSVPQISKCDVAYVLRVIDGDTIEVEMDSSIEKIRYIGMDAPETVAPHKTVQCYGLESSKRNKELVEGRFVLLEKEISERDKYGRLLRSVHVPAATSSVGFQLVQEGYARALTIPPDIKDAKKFASAEEEARAAGRGLWGRCRISFFSATW